MSKMADLYIIVAEQVGLDVDNWSHAELVRIAVAATSKPGKPVVDVIDDAIDSLVTVTAGFAA